MAGKKRGNENKYIAKLVSGKRFFCAFCRRGVDDEVMYGKLYSIGDLQCHYFCVLLSSCLVQKGSDEDGLFGFLYHDIVAEVERSKKHKCSYCGREGATLGCSVTQCRKQFHLPCGRERFAVSLFYGSYKSFCQNHAPKQKIPDNIMAKAKARKSLRNKRTTKWKQPRVMEKLDNLKEFCTDKEGKDASDTESVCVICYEPVEGYPTTETFWPPCCARDAWFHRPCLQRMALSAGMHYLKCPLCNDKKKFYEAVVDQGYYVPDRDAAWELEQNAFAEIYERPTSCGASDCRCPMGRDHDADTGVWVIKLCILCGSVGIHVQCLVVEETGEKKAKDGEREETSEEGAIASRARFVCCTCRPAAPDDLEQLERQIESVVLSQQNEETEASSVERSRPVMPSRMSLRRTKQRIMAYDTASSSSACNDLSRTEVNSSGHPSDILSSRLELNLKTPRKRNLNEPPSRVLKENNMSPVKLLQQRLYNKISSADVEKFNSDKIIQKVKRKFKKPMPLSVKIRILDKILEDALDSLPKESPKKNKDPVKAWSSPKKCCDLNSEVLKEYQENNIVNPIEGIINIEQPFEQNIKIENIEQIGNFNEKSVETCVKNDTEVKEASKTSPIKLIYKTRTLSEHETHQANIIGEGITNNSDINKDNQSIADDESSNSTFQLPPEFVADHNSDDSLPIFDTPKKLKTVDIKKDSSMEISENNEIINIDLITMEENSPNKDFIKNLNIKSPVKSKKCAYKFSPIDKETLQKDKVDIDLESFKNHYLNEVDRGFKCNFSHKDKHIHSENSIRTGKLRTAIDFAIEASYNSDNKQTSIDKQNNENKKLKRKLKTTDSVARKKIKRDNGKGYVLRFKKPDSQIKVVCSNTEKTRRAKKKISKSKKKLKTKLSVRDRNIKVNIKWKKERLKLKITESKIKKKKQSSPNNLKQCILNYPIDALSPKNVLIKPEHEIKLIKKKHVREEKSTDNLVQTSIDRFFKVKSPATE